MSELRAVLEGIVYGDDPKITPGDRLRAAEQLREIQAAAWPTVQQLLNAMPPDEIAAEWDRHFGAAMVREAMEGRSRYPRLTEALTAAVTKRAAEVARVLADADRVEAEVERRTQEGAELLYRTRAFSAVTADDVPAVADDPPEVADEPELAPPGLSVADMQRPFRPGAGQEAAPTADVSARSRTALNSRFSARPRFRREGARPAERERTSLLDSSSAVGHKARAIFDAHG